MEDLQQIINIGIVAHVDAGKTSLTEHFLHKSGLTRSLGSVDKGTSQTDWLPIEKERGISVRSASASFLWKNIQINLIDTPGHVDFAAEVERSLPALDAAILVVSALEGVQAHTETLWMALQKLKIPSLIFVNKIDRSGVDMTQLMNELTTELSQDLLFLQSVAHEGSQEASLLPLFAGLGAQQTSSELAEQIIGKNDRLLEKYLNEETVSEQELLEAFVRQIAELKGTPVLFGSAKFDVGIDTLLDAVCLLLPKARGDRSKPLSGIVFKVEHDKQIGRIASVRLFNGLLNNRDNIKTARGTAEEKVSQIRKLQGQKFEDVGTLTAGDIGAVCGLSSVRAGDIIGDGADIPVAVSLNTALLTLQLSPEKEEDYPLLVSALQQLTDEDPALELLWLKEERSMHIRIMGLIQLEIMEAVLADRYGLKVHFGEPSVIYKETAAGIGEGFDAYTMPKPCWAVVRFRIEPGERGSGVSYQSEVGVNAIATKYQNEIARTIPLALQQGIQGWEVTDVKITLIDGEDHVMHSRPGDFAIATPMAIMNGLANIGTKLLEPLLDFTLTAPEEHLGKVVGNLTQLRATFEAPAIRQNKFVLSGTVPVATTLDYAVKLSALTGGKGKFVTHFAGYGDCPDGLEKSVPFRGISPLDRSKYILKARKAIQ